MELDAIVTAGGRVLILIAAPPLIAAMVIGLIVGLVQALTSISEPTLSFVPRLLGVVAALYLSAQFIAGQLARLLLDVFDAIAAGGA